MSRLQDVMEETRVRVPEFLTDSRLARVAPMFGPDRAERADRHRRAYERWYYERVLKGRDPEEEVA